MTMREALLLRIQKMHDAVTSELKARHVPGTEASLEFVSEVSSRLAPDMDRCARILHYRYGMTSEEMADFLWKMFVKSYGNAAVVITPIQIQFTLPNRHHDDGSAASED